ncbi:MAG: cytochrome c oxidase assembly protein [Actinomycetota bacterium]
MRAHAFQIGTGWAAWSFDPAVVAGLVVAGALYLRGVRRLRSSGALHGFTAGREAAFFLGLTTVAAAVMSPLDARSSGSFALHMTQHMVLMLVSAPLVVYGAPGVALGLGLPVALRRRVNRILATRPFKRLTRILLLPLVVWALHTAALWAWHLPSLYEGAVSSYWLHALEHLALLGTAGLLWALVLPSPRGRRIDRGVAAGLVFITGLQSGALGVLLAFAADPLYEGGVLGGALGLDPLADQQLAGMLMWVPGGLLYLTTIAVLLYRWIEGMDAHMEAHPVALDSRKRS